MNPFRSLFAATLALFLGFSTFACAADWTPAASLAKGRFGHTATLLASGKVLVAGGRDSNSSFLASAELYDPATDSWSAAGNFGTPRNFHSATLLPDGKVLIAGGYNDYFGELRDAALYDPATNTWSVAGGFVTGRYAHTATLLPSGKVLVAGPNGGSGELYDPATNAWSRTGNMVRVRFDHTATLLPNGKVLVAGGDFSTTSAEIYDPATDAWSATGNLTTARATHTATLLPSGKVLVAGGRDLSSAELFDPATNTWSAAGNLGTARFRHTATLLPNGTVIVAGGVSNLAYSASAEIYDPVANTWSAAGSLATPRDRHTANLLPNGKVLVTGGYGIASAELYERDPTLVTSAADAGPGALRGVLAAVPTGSTITFDPALSGQTITVLTVSDESDVSAFYIPTGKAVTIDATALPAGLTIDAASGGLRFFRVSTGASLTLHGIKLIRGGGGDHFIDGGAAIYNRGTLTMTKCTLSGNRVDEFDSPDSGGAINNSGTATLTLCTLSNNLCRAYGGAILSSGSGSSMTLTHCTLTGNTAHKKGGAISGGRVTLRHCTISGNTAHGSFGGGGGVAAGPIVMENCIVAGNQITDSTSNGADILNSGNLTSNGANIVQDLYNLPGSGTQDGTGTIANVEPLLASLADNGGSTQTMALLANSPARNAAAVLEPAITGDQRGFPIASVPDIGAFEFPNTPPAAPDGTATATTGDSKTITLPATDADSDTLTISGTTPDSHITVNSTSGLDVTFTPATNFVGDATLGYTVSDVNGVTASGTITVTITDNDAPSISGTFSPRTVLAGAMPDFRGQANASDNVGTPTITQSPMAGSATVAGVITVTVSATDAAGNTSQSSFNLDVRPLAPVHTPHIFLGDIPPGAGGHSGAMGSAVIAGFNQPSISEAGDVAFLGKWKSRSSEGTALFLNDKCIAVTGPTYKRFTDPAVDNDTVATIATLTTGGSAVLTGSTATGAIIARTGEIAPDATGFQHGIGAKFKAFKAVDIHQGRVAIFAQLAAPAGSDLGIWLKQGNGPLRLALREGQIVDGKTIKTIVTFLPGNESPGQGRGALTRDGLGALVLFTDKTQSVVFAHPDGTTQLATVGEAVNPTLPDLKFASFGIPAVNDAIESTFLATLQPGTGGVTKANARGVFLASDQGDYQPIARIGDPTGFDTAVFTKLSDPVLSENGGVAFTATQKGRGIKGLTTKTLWWKPAGEELGLLALGGNPAVDVPDSQWKSFDTLAITDRGPIFAATLVAGKGGVTAATAKGVWACDFTGNLRKLFRTGDTINGKKLAKFTLLKATVGNVGVTRSFNNAAQVVWLAEFTDKSSAIITTEVP